MHVSPRSTIAALRAGRLIALAGLLAAPLACADEESCEDPLRVCDIGSADCREHVYAQTACVRGHDGRAVPTVYTITRDEFEGLLRQGDEPTAEQQRVDAQSAVALRMLDLLPAGTTSTEEAAIEAYARNVLAFYSRSDASVTIVETNLGDVDRETSVFVLSHEFVHAQQDIDVGLQDFFDAHSTSSDSNVALRSVTEGEAVLFSNVTMARQPGAAINAEVFDQYYAQQQQSLRDAAAGSSDAAYTDLSSSFPYPFGGQLVTDRWLAEGSAGVFDLYDDPPLSTATILRTLVGAEPANSVDLPSLSADAIPAGWSIIADDTLGAWILFAVARRSGFAEELATELAEDWGGDHILIAGGPNNADVALAWTLRFGSEASAMRFAEIDATSASMGPPEGVRSVRQVGRDVTLVMAVDDDALVVWETTFEAATVEVDPGFRSTGRARLAPPLPAPIDDPRAN